MNWPSHIRDFGAETARNYRYQYGYGMILLVDALLGIAEAKDYHAIWCEHYDDFLAEISEFVFDSYQIKTATPESGAWQLNNETLRAAIGKMVELEDLFPGKIRRFKFLSNVQYAKAGNKARRHLSPVHLLTQIAQANAPKEMDEAARKGFAALRSHCACSSETLFGVLKRLDLAQGPGRDDFEAVIINSHLAYLPQCKGHSHETLRKVYVGLEARIHRASSLAGNDPGIHHVCINLPADAQPQLRNKRIDRQEVLAIIQAVLASAPLTAEHRPLWSIPAMQWEPEWMPPGALLRADLGAVEFHARQSEMSDLREWCGRPERAGIKLCVGPGGMGKSRLAIELCKDMVAQERWRAGFLDCNSVTVAMQNAQLPQAILNDTTPLLLVVDYAESRGEIIEWLTQQFLGSQLAKVRFLLLARKPGEWFDRLKTGSPLRELLAGDTFSLMALKAVALDLAGRRESYCIALRDFAAKLNQTVPDTMPDELEADHFNQVLLLHMHALASIEGVQVKGADGILDYHLNRETAYWKRQLLSRGVPENLEPGIGQAMAVVTMNFGLGNKQAGLALLEALPFFSGQPQAVLESVNQLLADCYPGERWIEPVLPDLLGERLCERILSDEETQTIIYSLFLPKESGN